jgi:hypothetical protein
MRRATTGAKASGPPGSLSDGATHRTRAPRGRALSLLEQPFFTKAGHQIVDELRRRLVGVLLIPSVRRAEFHHVHRYVTSFKRRFRAVR